MPPAAPIPRFLLPQGGAIWRTRLSSLGAQTQFIRNFAKAHKKPSKPLVLEKPTKFNPPSHGARLRKPAPRYPGPQLSEEEAAAQKTKKYPHMMPPDGSFMHWLLHNKIIHVYFSLTTLFVLAGFVWFTNFKRNSPFADLLPSWGSLVFNPITTVRRFFDVVKMNSDYVTQETMERRRRKVEDVQKRAQYRKAHGLDETEAFGGWTAKTDKDMLGPGIPIGPGKPTREDGEGKEEVVEEPQREKRPVKKWLGIW